jgi:hypothetical protein
LLPPSIRPVPMLPDLGAHERKIFTLRLDHPVSLPAVECGE